MVTKKTSNFNLRSPHTCTGTQTHLHTLAYTYTHVHIKKIKATQKITHKVREKGIIVVSIPPTLTVH